jgi:copper chaperone NosL
MKKMSKTSRIIIAVASLALIAAYFLPVWFIYLLAPQYPEGLSMQIWLNRITGDVDIINGLNHYIGMKHISVEMFPEFTYLVYVVAFFIVYGLTIAITGSRKLLFSYLVITSLGAVAALYDFYKWGYDYGHNLDPKAAIQVPGLSYQPPLIGHKTLLNFDAYSYPDSGGWVVIVSSLIFFAVWFLEWRRSKKTKTKRTSTSIKKVAAASSFLLFTLSSCETEPQPFQYGKDICDDCRMTIMEPQFGAELITKKGRIFHFDDLHCLVNFRNKGSVKDADVSKIVSIDYNDSKNFINVDKAWFVKSDQLKSPMNSNTASFADKEIAEKKAAETKGTLITWKDLSAGK